MSYENEPYKRLANEVVLQAVKDYRSVLRKLRWSKKQEKAWNQMKQIETFFKSKYYGMLTELNSENLMKKLKEECTDECKGISDAGEKHRQQNKHKA